MIVINFTPSQMGNAEAVLDISSDAVNAAQITASLSGIGVAAVIDAPLNLDFAAQDIGQSQTLLLPIANTGTAPLNVTSLSSNEPSFVAGNAPASIAPGDTATLEVTFAPNRAGVIAGVLTIDNDSNNTSQWNVSLNGEGLTSVETGLLATPLALAFGDVELDESASLIVTVSSIGTDPVTLSSVALDGAGGFALEAIPATPVVLAPGESRDIEVVFTPDALGPFSDQLEIQSDDANDPVINVLLNGMGVDMIAAPDGQP